MYLLSKKNTCRFVLSIFLTIFITVLLTILFAPCFTVKKAYAKSSASFVRTYKTLTVHQKVQYKIKNKKKTESVRFSTSNSSLASIDKKTGWLIPEKYGKLTVKATIYNKNQKKIKTLRSIVTIQKKKNILPNAAFQIKENINPWNFTFTLSCNRILLKKEIDMDKLTIFPKGKKKPKLTASFTKLSDDGKEITYTLDSSSQTKLCPGNASMDGTYVLESLRFSKKLSLTYQERLTNQTLSGFVFKTNGNSVKNALVTLKKGTKTIGKCYTDSNGHYQLQNASGAENLTVEKSGFQKSTIQNPFISAKGTTCENITLRSKEEIEITLGFFITDRDDNPVSNAAIDIIEEKNVISANHPISDNILENTNCMMDSFSQENILFSGKTDSNGKLLLTNTSSPMTAAACSNFILDHENLLTYSSYSEFSSTKRTILSPSAFDCNKNYIIYIRHFSPDDSQSAYNTKRINFSFSSLLTNQAFLHVKLERCQQSYINNLSVNCDIPPSFCRSLMLQFFLPNQKEPFYEYAIEKDFFQISDNQIMISSLLLPISLPDDTYYLCIQAHSEKGKILSKSGFVICQISNSELSIHSSSLQKTNYARILAYGNFNHNLLSKASFQLFQKCDNHYFQIGTFSTEQFNKTDSEFSTSNLYLNSLLPDSDYVLVPLSGHIIAKKYLSFTTVKDKLFPSKENASYSLTPLARIPCYQEDSSELSIKEQSENKQIILSAPDDFYTDTLKISYPFLHDLSQDFIRSCQTYPNCVIAIYQSDGTLLTSTLTTSPTDKNFKKHSIIDIYPNKKLLITNWLSS